METETIYDHPRYYDILFGWDRTLEADFHDRLLRQCGVRPRAPLLEVACGTARVARLLARRGWDVTGLDLRPGMLAFARARAQAEGLRLATLLADMTQFQAPAAFAAAFNPMSSFRMLHSDAAAVAHLRCMAAALEPNGIYALDLTLARTGDEPATTTSESWEMSDGDVTVRAEDDGVTVSDAGVERVLAWGADVHLRPLTAEAFVGLVAASEGFDLLGWHPEISRGSGVSEFEIRPSATHPAGRCMVALRRR